MIVTCSLDLYSSSIKSDSIFSIWNSDVGRSSSPSSQGISYGQYPIAQSASSAIDQSTSTKFLSFGNSTVNVPSVLGGIGTGFYVSTTLGTLSIFTRFRMSTGNDRPERDPIIVSIEGSRGGNLTRGAS